MFAVWRFFAGESGKTSNSFRAFDSTRFRSSVLRRTGFRQRERSVQCTSAVSVGSGSVSTPRKEFCVFPQTSAFSRHISLPRGRDSARFSNLRGSAARSVRSLPGGSDLAYRIESSARFAVSRTSIVSGRESYCFSGRKPSPGSFSPGTACFYSVIRREPCAAAVQRVCGARRRPARRYSACRAHRRRTGCSRRSR